MGQDGISTSRLSTFFTWHMLNKHGKRGSRHLFVVSFSAPGLASVDDPITCDDSISKRIANPKRLLAWTPRCQIWASTSASSHNRFSYCATHGVAIADQAIASLTAHGPRWGWPASRGSGWGLKKAFNGLWVFSSYVASLKHACRDEMHAIFPVCSGSLGMFSHVNLLVPSHFAGLRYACVSGP